MIKNVTKKQLIYRKDGPIPPPIKIGDPLGYLYENTDRNRQR